MQVGRVEFSIQAEESFKSGSRNKGDGLASSSLSGDDHHGRQWERHRMIPQAARYLAEVPGDVISELQLTYAWLINQQKASFKSVT